MATNARRTGAKRADEAGARDSRNAPGRESRAPAEISKWEWLVGGIGLLVLLALLGFLAREAMAPQTPPDLVARVDSVSRGASGWLAHVRVHNRGRGTAVSVTVEGEFATPAGDTLRSETTLDYVPGLSRRGGGLLFDEDPRLGKLEVRVIGFQEP
jgi:uncharacterized protein (TIGR02588 family)